jgi:hypothetical protein
MRREKEEGKQRDNQRATEKVNIIKVHYMHI